jgi:hypothetical protein
MPSVIHGIWVNVRERFVVVMESTFYDEMLTTAEAAGPNIVGTPILGGRMSDNTIILLGVTPVPPDSVFDEKAGVRGTEGLDEYFRKMQAESGGRANYVGEWHSRHSFDCGPSDVDRVAMAGLLERPDAPDAMVLVVAALGGSFRESPELSVTVFAKGGREVKLSLVRAPGKGSWE